MSERVFERGLVVGKFSPLHRGHELVVGRALAMCRQVFVLSYSNPELPGCPPLLRRRWLERAFPSARCVVLAAAGVPANDAPDDVHRRFVASVCLEVFGVTVDAVFTSEEYGDGFASVLSGLFGHHVTHVMVDRDRSAVPISATRIRDDVHGHREFVPPHVYATFVERITVLGGESSGKSTLAAALAAEFDTEQVAEYGREHWVQRGGNLTFDDLLQIGQRQVELEDRASERARRYLFCDTSPLTTLFYSREMFGRADPRLEALAEREYTLTVLCAPDFPFVQDGTRRAAPFRDAQHRWYEAELGRRGTPYVLVTGAVERRVRAVRSALSFVCGSP